MEHDWGLKAVVCRKVQTGKGRCCQQRQEGVLIIPAKEPKQCGGVGG